MRQQFCTFILALVFLAVCGQEGEPEGARLLVTKNVLNKYLVENMDVIVKVTANLILLVLLILQSFCFFSTLYIT